MTVSVFFFLANLRSLCLRSAPLGVCLCVRLVCGSNVEYTRVLCAGQRTAACVLVHAPGPVLPLQCVCACVRFFLFGYVHTVPGTAVSIYSLPKPPSAVPVYLGALFHVTSRYCRATILIPGGCYTSIPSEQIALIQTRSVRTVVQQSTGTECSAIRHRPTAQETITT